jgi:hypothetical protein
LCFLPFSPYTYSLFTFCLLPFWSSD